MTADHSTARSLPAKPRDPSLDFVKGLLVEVMILFHSFEFFVSARFAGLNYLAFVTGAFVFLTGAIVTEIYLSRFHTDPLALLRRLVWRSCKLLLLFSAINVAFCAVVGGSSHKHSVNALLQAAGSIFGQGNKTIVAFEMLVPIAYSLAAAGAIVYITRHRWFLAAISVGVFIALTALAPDAFNVRFLALGLLGLSYGLLRNYRGFGRAGIAIAITAVIAFVAYLASVALMPEDTPWIYAGGVIAVVEVFRSVRLYLPLPRWVCFVFEEFGRYSLFGYIAQIFFLRALLFVIGAGLGGLGYAAGPVIVCNLVLLGSIVLISRLRLQFLWFDGLYRAIFG